jgi:hypothetical protein
MEKRKVEMFEEDERRNSGHTYGNKSKENGRNLRGMGTGEK